MFPNCTFVCMYVGAHPLQFRPAPENLVSKLANEEHGQPESEDGEDVGGGEGKMFKKCVSG